ncbi:MAG: tetratricopeptide repeat protein [Ferrovum sp.]|nr:tetratricopeptide repeat protein [Ferrovum sp.]NDU87108.1 tetratricopeptide repeat protein [Ferrovum sp.]
MMPLRLSITVGLLILSGTIVTVCAEELSLSENPDAATTLSATVTPEAHPNTTPNPPSQVATSPHVTLTLQQLLHDHQYDQALTLADHTLEDQPDNGQVLFLKALALTQLHRTDDAIVLLKNLTERFPEMVATYNNLAALYASQGHLEDARATLEKGVRAQPNYATAYENLGDVYAALARQSYARALKLDPANRPLKLKAEKLN